MLRELARSYLTIVKDLTRVMNRLKALYRSWAIPCAGRDVYYTHHRSDWLAKIREAGVRRRAEQLYQQLDMLQHCANNPGENCWRRVGSMASPPSYGRFRRWAHSLGPGGGSDSDPQRFRTKRQ